MPPKKAAAAEKGKAKAKAPAAPAPLPPPTAPPPDSGPAIDALSVRIRAAIAVFDPEATTLLPVASLHPLLASLGLFVTDKEVADIILPSILAPEPPPPGSPPLDAAAEAAAAAAAAAAASAPPPTSVPQARVFAEVRRLMAAHAFPAPSVATLLAAFQAFDKGCTGMVPIDKLRRALTHPTTPGSLSPDAFAAFLALLPIAEDASDVDADSRRRNVRYDHYVTLAQRGPHR